MSTSASSSAVPLPTTAVPASAIAPPVQDDARHPWHAKLAAIRTGRELSRAAAPAERAASPVVQPQASARAAAATAALDPGLVGVPLTLRSHHRDLFMAFGGVDREGGRWVLRQAGKNEYNLVAAGGSGAGAFLGVTAQGPDVCMAPADDGSGLQRWVLEHVGDDAYSLRVAGGKRDDKVFLGARDDGAIRTFSTFKGEQTTWTLAALRAAPGAGCPAPPAPKPPAPTPAKPAPTPKPPTPAKPVPAKPVPPPAMPPATKVPGAMVPELTKTTGLTEKQIDVVLQLISLPENSTPKWWTNYDYIEFLGDGRGFTATLFGACSGTGDLIMIFDELAKISPRSSACDLLLTYRETLRKKRGDDIKGIEPIKGIIRGLGDDPAWQQAVWKVYADLYWKFAADWADKKGEAAKRPGPRLTLPATRGFVVDTSINHGSDYESLMYVVKRMKNPDSKDEVAWSLDFAETRRKILKSGYQDLDTSKTGDRCVMWADVIRNNPQLKTPYKAYKGYWGSFTVQ